MDDRNPTGYAQVLAEYPSVTTDAAPGRAYTFGHDLIAQRRDTGSSGSPTWTTSYYGYDGHGSVRLLLDASSSAGISDTYDFDAWGTLLARSGSTPNAYRYAGEQWDDDLGMYFLRARYYRPDSGRFWTMDSFEGHKREPISLHKYLYCHADPVNGIDPSGNENLPSLVIGNALRTSTAGFNNAAVVQAGVRAAATINTVAQAAASSYAAYLSTDLMLQTTVREWIDKAKEILRRRRPETQMKKVVPVPAAIIPQVAQHVETAQASRGLFLTRASIGQATKNRAKVMLKAWPLTATGMSWDEYPFASSEEGGNVNTVSIWPVQKRENWIQGAIVGWSYFYEKIQPGDEFAVIVIP